MNRLFFRILLYFLSLLLPLVLIGTLFYVQATNRLKEEFTGKIQMNLTSSVDTVDIYLRTAQETSNSFFYDQKLLLRPYGDYAPSERMAMAETTRALAIIANNIRELIDKIFVYADDEKVYSSGGLDDFDIFFNKVYNFSRYGEAYWADKLRNGKTMEILETSVVRALGSAPQNVVPFVFRNEMKGHKVVVVMTISADMILKTIARHSIVDATRHLVVDSVGNVILNNSEAFATEDAPARLKLAFGDETSGSSRLVIGGTAYIVNYVQSENYMWSYYSITPEAEFRKHTQYFIISMVAVCIVLAVIGIVFSFIFSFNLYNPIKRIRDALAARDEEQVAGLPDDGRRNEFDYIGMHVDRLIRHNEQFQQELTSLASEYRDRELLLHMQGRSEKTQAEVEKLLPKGWLEDRQSFGVCAIRISYGAAFFDEIQDVERMLIQSKMIKIIHAIASGDDRKVCTLEEDEGAFVCLFRLDDPEGASQIRTAMETLVGTFRFDARYCDIRIGIGSVHDGVAGIRRSYSEAESALEAAGAQESPQIVEAGRLTSFVASADAEESRDRKRTLVSSVIHYIEGNYHHDLYLENIAAQFDISTKYMSRIFKENTGVNLVSYVSWYRISRAKELLASTGLGVAEISERVGIYSRTTFIRLFKKYVGTTPNQYREQNK